MKSLFLLLFAFFSTVINLSAQCQPTVFCPAPVVQTTCDLSENDTLFWNAPYFWENNTLSHNLPEVEADLGITVLGICPQVQVRALLFLDLDGDNIQETVVDTDSLPTSNTVYVGNATNPNYTGGTPRAFDHRIVTTDLKYGWALETTVSGDTTRYKLKWNTPAQPSTYVLPQLPLGKHRMEWTVTGDTAFVCGKNIELKDCLPPVLTLGPPLQLHVLAGGTTQTIWASDFVEAVTDNVTPPNYISYAIRNAGVGTGWPISYETGGPLTTIQFPCCDIGPMPVEIWARDLAGNLTFEIGEVWVQDNGGFCFCNGVTTFLTCAKTELGDPMEGVKIEVSDESHMYYLPDIFTQFEGCNNSMILPNGLPISLLPSFDNNILNGVSTFDLVQISRHILGIQTLNSPYKLIAADANRSGSVSSFDIVEIRRLILGINQTYPNNTSWRFIDQDHVFSDPANPFTTVFLDTIHYFADFNVGNLQKNILLTGIKIGDVNNSALAKPSSNNTCTKILIEDAGNLQVGEIRDITVYLEDLEAFCGFQMGLLFDPNAIEILDITSDLPLFGIGSYYSPISGTLNLSWSDADSYLSTNHQPLFTLKVKALEAGTIPSVFYGINGISPEAIDCEAGINICLELDYLLNSKVHIYGCAMQYMEEVAVEFKNNDGISSFDLTNADGYAVVPGLIPVGTTLNICPHKDETTLTQQDVADFSVRVAQHISGEQPFTSPYQWIAADINRDSIINSQDVTYLSDLLLGVVVDLPDNSFWRFVPKNFVFQDPANPLAFHIPECIKVDSLSNDVDYEFLAIQLGKLFPTCNDNVSSSEVQKPTLQVRPPQPNPSSDGVSISVTTETWNRLSITITDLNGRVVYENTNHFVSGDQTLEIPRSAFPIGGVYIWKISNGQTLASGKIVRI